ncbi:MAG TPA: hypothetical protein PKD64_03605 [Pirellulaceae bacterium]|nr:hypothetical protein [Pirellulaceae bacterium]HMO91256.1 hypothetical protein [Pirellulaceae bacterium]HMP68560.1 hypothetical protein [Pirellulaceae bacterium]
MQKIAEQLADRLRRERIRMGAAVTWAQASQVRWAFGELISASPSDKSTTVSRSRRRLDRLWRLP